MTGGEPVSLRRPNPPSLHARRLQHILIIGLQTGDGGERHLRPEAPLAAPPSRRQTGGVTQLLASSSIDTHPWALDPETRPGVYYDKIRRKDDLNPNIISSDYSGLG